MESTPHHTTQQNRKGRALMDDAQCMELRHTTLKKSNDLIQRSRFSLSLQQQKIISYIIGQITPFDEEFREYEFAIQDFCRVCGILTDGGKNYANLKSAIKNLSDKSLWVTLANGDETLLRWIETAKITNGGGTIKIRLNNDMKPFLLQLKKNYTQYELIFVMFFKSKYTVRLYELVKSIHYNELREYKRRYSLNDLRRILDAETYKTFQHFKDRVIVPSVREINEYSDKNLSFMFIKTGRAFTHIEFTIESKDSLATLKIRDKLDKEMGLLPGQTTLLDELKARERK